MNLYNLQIEIKEMVISGLKEYKKDYWNYIELIAILSTMIYNILDILLVYGAYDPSPELKGIL